MLLWDEGADKNAERAVNKLREIGIKATYVKIRQQPDNYPEKTLADIVKNSHKLAKNGKGLFLDAR